MYKPDLAYIHDVGFADWAVKSAPGILKALSACDIVSGIVVDLGCGSGILANVLLKSGYKVEGIDISSAMIQIARKRAPGARFRVGSVATAKLPSCRAVTSISECLNYISKNSDDHRVTLLSVFRKVFRSLEPGGMFIFDLAEPGQAWPGETIRGFTEGRDWLVLVEKTEEPATEILTRRIITFKKTGRLYRRSDEVHHQALYRSADIARELRAIGFSVRVSHSYGDFQLPPGRAAFFARKPR